MDFNLLSVNVKTIQVLKVVNLHIKIWKLKTLKLRNNFTHSGKESIFEDSKRRALVSPESFNFPHLCQPVRVGKYFIRRY